MEKTEKLIQIIIDHKNLDIQQIFESPSNSLV